jgi:hypothetical protein
MRCVVCQSARSFCKGRLLYFTQYSNARRRLIRARKSWDETSVCCQDEKAFAVDGTDQAESKAATGSSCQRYVVVVGEA